jgi:PleD family two-component response regulator
MQARPQASLSALLLPAHLQPGTGEHMSNPTPTAPLVLLASPDEVFTRSLESVLTPAGYAILRTYTASSALAQAQRVRPDALILATDLTEPTGLELCRALREQNVVTPSTPILLTHRGPSARNLRLDALRAGADELWGQPLDTEEFALRLAAQLRSKFDAERAREQSLVDERSTLWNDRGLMRRAEELLALTLRHHDPLTVAVFAVDNGTGQDWDLGDRLAEGLSRSARLSDAVGRLGPTRFAVVAPRTGPGEAARLGERLLERLDQVTGPGAPVRVGFASVADAATAPPVSELVQRAASVVRGGAIAGRTGPRSARVSGWTARTES